MPKMTGTETLGFMTRVQEYMENHKAKLLAKGLDVTNWITELGDQREDLETKNDEQEEIKAQLKTKTMEVDASQDTGYKSASTKLDACVGTFGKTTPDGKQGAKIRSTVRRGPRKPKTP